MRAGIHRPFAIVTDTPAPENRLALIVKRLQLDPGIEGIDRAAGEKMADLAGTNYNINPNAVPAANGRTGLVQRGGYRNCRPGSFACGWHLSFLADGESCL